ncbi:MAG: hypothetical protein MUP98_10460 [Candidatus Aminicenantes bacterium]|nr:hypothetical protein [Candidatus Aminicenantes bacterium]
MKLKSISFLAILFFSTFLYAGVYPQAGIESYLGTNNMRLFTPWVGIRVNLSPNASFLLKYYNHNLSYNYINNHEVEIQRKASLSNFTTGIYAQKKNVYFFGALSYFRGTDAYRALAFDGGIGTKIIGNLSAEIGTYLIRESSILWHPNEDMRYIFLYSIKGGLKYKITKWLTIQARFNLYQNVEDVKASSVMAGLQIIPWGPLFFNIYYIKYSESADYQFSGDFLSMGINIYY